MNFYITLSYLIIYAIFSVCGIGLIKKELGINPITQLTDYFSLLMSLRVIFGFFFIFLGSLVMFKALSFGKMAVLVPIANGFTFTFTVLMGVFVFHEKIIWMHLLGLMLIIGGIIVLSFAEKY